MAGGVAWVGAEASGVRCTFEDATEGATLADADALSAGVSARLCTLSGAGVGTMGVVLGAMTGVAVSNVRCTVGWLGGVIVTDGLSAAEGASTLSALSAEAR